MTKAAYHRISLLEHGLVARRKAALLLVVPVRGPKRASRAVSWRSLRIAFGEGTERVRIPQAMSASLGTQDACRSQGTSLTDPIKMG